MGTPDKSRNAARGSGSGSACDGRAALAVNPHYGKVIAGCTRRPVRVSPPAPRAVSGYRSAAWSATGTGAPSGESRPRQDRLPARRGVARFEDYARERLYGIGVVWSHK